ncbi:hypothetical protein FS594_26875 (plasmid) [Rahnella aquatilis]|uniref:NAD-dependent epimerase/dehydratase domain-containing protein n=1 Tax=Rahnella perminowiae TaxID=2816244 RepID=A0ABS6KVK6_9GAMM|nr:hypothetical protein [Rahnella perminowiae]MBU9833557.1 hypothetical protein [Rahnella perminowiae]UJD92380.1 hypothetical protein FS594_26875 [Rahnella aquatilis]
MQIFITDATGLIGSATVRYLVAADHQVTSFAYSGRAAELLQALGTKALPRDDWASYRVQFAAPCTKKVENTCRGSL